MKKSELKTGMIVTTRDGVEWLVLKDIGFAYTSSCGNTYKDGVLINILYSSSWNGLRYYDEDLMYQKKSLDDDNYDIVKVERVDHPTDMLNIERLKNKNLRTLLWERKEIKEVTMAEVEEKFGCKVKIINVN